MFTMVHNGLQWFTVVYNGYNRLLWFTLVHYGLQWFTMVYNGLKWFAIVYNESQNVFPFYEYGCSKD